MTDEDSHLEAEYEDRFVADTDVDDFINSIDDEPTISDMPTDEPPATVARKGDAIYGGEGFGTVRRRNLLVLQDLPVYLKIAGHPEAGIDRSLQLQMLEPDIREAMAKAARKLHDTAMKHSVTGYTWDLDDIEYDIQNRTVIATLGIERE